MIATLGCYEDWFGPYHPHTLRLAVTVGAALRDSGDRVRARQLLERALRDLGRLPDPAHELETLVTSSLRDLLVEQHEFVRAGELQSHVVARAEQHFGREHRETVRARALLAEILFRGREAEREKPNGPNHRGPFLKAAGFWHKPH